MIAGVGAFEETSPWIFVYNETDNQVYVTFLLSGSFLAFDIATQAAGDGQLNRSSVLKTALAVSMRHTDGKVFVGFLDDTLNAVSELQMWSLTEVNQIIRLTNVLSSPIAGPFAEGINMMIDQSLGTLLVTYLRGANSDNMTAYWKESINGGLNWSVELAMMEDADDDIDSIQCPISTPGTGKGRFQVATWNDDTKDYRSSALNNAPIGGYTVSNAGPDQTTVDCQSGMVQGGAEAGLGLKRGYQNYLVGSRQAFISLGATKRGSLVVGDPVVGATSGATGTFLGWNESLNRIHIGNVIPGHKSRSDTPFLPNETIHKVGDDSDAVEVASSPAYAAVDISIPSIDT